ncbi:PrsW family intramembrane metalloprotease [Brunnivagina elsteri]|uniref:PrsW family intramembrane metalloprotease n=1 Tax=Brunnivagina elsteri CCALA 953 TaxID=987040 RepID=A0A2A2TBF3_9CYAN|nr:PrsW family intramembrane metalloprotease [Calothrix elsteri]PAX47897.1 PrsW family intramembrane metalloprotease [Calothrix elsteri CCALA 953]
MTQPNLLEQAKKGDVNAIASLINRLLQNQGIDVEASLEDGCLQVWLKSNQVPDRQTSVAFIRKGMMGLGVTSIKTVRIYAQQASEDMLSWDEEVELEQVNNANNVNLEEQNNYQQNLQFNGNNDDIESISVILNNSFKQQKITLKIGIKENCLQILLESVQVPNQSLCTAIIRKELVRLKIESIKTVKVYGREIEEEFPAWFQEFELGIGKLIPITPKKQQAENPEFLATLWTFKFSSVVPYHDALNSDLYKTNTVRLLLFFGLFPFAVSLIAKTAGLALMAFILGIYYSSIWGIVLYNLLKPAIFSWRNTVKCALFTAFIGIPILLLCQRVPPFSLLYTAVKQENLIPQLIGFIFGVGVLEESCKALPVYLFLMRPGKLKDPLTSAFYGAMSGLGFAIAEGVNYSFQYAISLATGESGFGFYVLINTIRFVSLPLYHAIWAGIVGYFLGLAAINPSRKGSIIFIGLGISAVLHGSYNTFSNGWIGFVILAFSILLFVTYLNRSQQIVDEMQNAELSFKK